MITWEQIEAVNQKVNKIEIRGKDYTCVPARVQAFRSICPMGGITTEIVQMEGGVVTIKATVTDENGAVLVLVPGKR